ncbi:MAG TPA: hypothetical protein VF930_04800, partial [Stellaceae bacterium]
RCCSSLAVRSASGDDILAMSGFVAIILIRVDNEIGCTTGWQDVVARSPLADDIGKGSYVKTLCRRGEAAPRQPR